MPLLNVALVPAPDQVVVRLSGESDLSTTPLLTDALLQAGGLGTACVVVDVAAVQFWDCSGLHALAEFTAELGRDGRHCRLVGASSATRRLVVLADFATSLALDGPLYLPAVAPEPVVRRRPEGGVGFSTASVAAAAAGSQRARRRPPAAPHPAPFRRREGENPAAGRRASPLTLRRWR